MSRKSAAAGLAKWRAIRAGNIVVGTRQDLTAARERDLAAYEAQRAALPKKPPKRQPPEGEQ